MSQPPALPDSPVQTPPAVEPESGDQPWGFWITIAFSAVIIATIFAASVLVGIGAGVYASMQLEGDEYSEFIRTADNNGLLVTFSGLVGTPVGLAWVLLFVALRQGISIPEYLALRPVKLRTLALWLAAAIGLGVFTDGLAYAFGQPVVPEFSLAWVSTAGSLPFMFFVIVFVTPILSEAFYRGFMFKGILHANPGVWGAIGITAAMYMVTQFQTVPFANATYFALGLLLAYARFRTGSLLTSYVMQAVWNLYALTTATVYVSIYGV